MRVVFACSIALIALVSTSCSGTDAVCAAGAQQNCDCADLSTGVQRCRADGLWGACLCAASDGSIPLPDTSIPRRDSSQPPVDTGVPPMDSGMPPMDSGMMPVDTGPPPVDTGPPPVDTGNPGTDAGVDAG